jgi:hypothetical protein
MLDTTLYVVGGVVAAATLIPAAVVIVGGWREHRRQQAASKPPAPEGPVFIAPVFPDLRPPREVNSKRIIDRLPEDCKYGLVYQIRCGTPYYLLARDLRSRGFRISEQAISAYAREILGLRRVAPYTKVNHQEVLRG